MPVGPHRRRHRPAGLRQDARPADPGAASRRPGAALVTLTKPDDLLLSLPDRSTGGRPCVVLDPFGLVPGLPELVWDPIAGCVDRMVAERRAKAFTAGTIHGSSHGSGDAAARFYAAEAAKVLMAYFHAAALTGKTLDDVARLGRQTAVDVGAGGDPAQPPALRPACGPGCSPARCAGTNGRPRTPSPPSSRPCRLFFQDDIRRRCVPVRRTSRHRHRRRDPGTAAPSTCSAARTRTRRRPR